MFYIIETKSDGTVRINASQITRIMSAHNGCRAVALSDGKIYTLNNSNYNALLKDIQGKEGVINVSSL